MDLERQPGRRGDLRSITAVLSEPYQRRVLSILRERSTPLTKRDLAVQLAARREDVPPSETSKRARRHAQRNLHHRHLPELEALDWIERRPDGIVVTERSSLDIDALPIPDLTAAVDPSWEALATLIAPARRRRVGRIVADRSAPLTLDELAAELSTADHAPAGEASDPDWFRAAIHHVDLPKLDGVDLIEYDPDEQVIGDATALAALVERLDGGDDRRGNVGPSVPI